MSPELTPTVASISSAPTASAAPGAGADIPRSSEHVSQVASPVSTWTLESLSLGNVAGVLGEWLSVLLGPVLDLGKAGSARLAWDGEHSFDHLLILDEGDAEWGAADFDLIDVEEDGNPSKADDEIVKVTGAEIGEPIEPTVEKEVDKKHDANNDDNPKVDTLNAADVSEQNHHVFTDPKTEVGSETNTESLLSSPAVESETVEINELPHNVEPLTQALNPTVSTVVVANAPPSPEPETQVLLDSDEIEKDEETKKENVLRPEGDEKEEKAGRRRSIKQFLEKADFSAYQSPQTDQFSTSLPPLVSQRSNERMQFGLDLDEISGYVQTSHTNESVTNIGQKPQGSQPGTKITLDRVVNDYNWDGDELEEFEPDKLAHIRRQTTARLKLDEKSIASREQPKSLPAAPPELWGKLTVMLVNRKCESRNYSPSKHGAKFLSDGIRESGHMVIFPDGQNNCPIVLKCENGRAYEKGERIDAQERVLEEMDRLGSTKAKVFWRFKNEQDFTNLFVESSSPHDDSSQIEKEKLSNNIDHKPKVWRSRNYFSDDDDDKVVNDHDLSDEVLEKFKHEESANTGQLKFDLGLDNPSATGEKVSKEIELTKDKTDKEDRRYDRKGLGQSGANSLVTERKFEKEKQDLREQPQSLAAAPPVLWGKLTEMLVYGECESKTYAPSKDAKFLSDGSLESGYMVIFPCGKNNRPIVLKCKNGRAYENDKGIDAQRRVRKEMTRLGSTKVQVFWRFKNEQDFTNLFVESSSPHDDSSQIEKDKLSNKIDPKPKVRQPGTRRNFDRLPIIYDDDKVVNGHGLSDKEFDNFEHEEVTHTRKLEFDLGENLEFDLEEKPQATAQNGLKKIELVEDKTDKVDRPDDDGLPAAGSPIKLKKEEIVDPLNTVSTRSHDLPSGDRPLHVLPSIEVSNGSAKKFVSQQPSKIANFSLSAKPLSTFDILNKELPILERRKSDHKGIGQSGAISLVTEQNLEKEKRDLREQPKSLPAPPPVLWGKLTEMLIYDKCESKTYAPSKDANFLSDGSLESGYMVIFPCGQNNRPIVLEFEDGRAYENCEGIDAQKRVQEEMAHLGSTQARVFWRFKNVKNEEDFANLFVESSSPHNDNSQIEEEKLSHDAEFHRREKHPRGFVKKWFPESFNLSSISNAVNFGRWRRRSKSADRAQRGASRGASGSEQRRETSGNVRSDRVRRAGNSVKDFFKRQGRDLSSTWGAIRNRNEQSQERPGNTPGYQRGPSPLSAKFYDPTSIPPPLPPKDPRRRSLIVDTETLSRHTAKTLNAIGTSVTHKDRGVLTMATEAMRAFVQGLGVDLNDDDIAKFATGIKPAADFADHISELAEEAEDGSLLEEYDELQARRFADPEAACQYIDSLDADRVLLTFNWRKAFVTLKRSGSTVAELSENGNPWIRCSTNEPATVADILRNELTSDNIFVVASQKKRSPIAANKPISTENSTPLQTQPVVDANRGGGGATENVVSEEARPITEEGETLSTEPKAWDLALDAFLKGLTLNSTADDRSAIKGEGAVAVKGVAQVIRQLTGVESVVHKKLSGAEAACEYLKKLQTDRAIVAFGTPKKFVALRRERAGESAGESAASPGGLWKRHDVGSAVATDQLFEGEKIEYEHETFFVIASPEPAAGLAPRI